jgi:hypothetical protein
VAPDPGEGHGHGSGPQRGALQAQSPEEEERSPPVSVHKNLVRVIWQNAVKKSGRFDVDPTTNRATTHPRVLRKYFHSQMKLGCPEEVVEVLMGHGGYLSGAFRRNTKREMADYYREAELYVTILIPEG